MNWHTLVAEDLNIQLIKLKGTGENPEEAVVVQREHLRADAGCVGAVHHVCAGDLHQDGCADGCGSGHGNGAAAEDQLQDSGHQEGEKQDRHIGAGEAVCDDVADAAGLDDVAECAACAGDEDDGTAALNTALEASRTS